MLDPHDWDAFSSLAHRALDDALGYLRTVRDRRVWTPVPDEVKRALDEPVPRRGLPEEVVYAQFRRDVLPYPTGNIHPRFWGWVMGTGTPLAALAELLAATMNPHLAGYDQSAALVEEQLLGWLRELMGFPAGATGVLTSGGTIANLLGLAAARSAGAGFDVRDAGLRDGPALAVYASTETHHWVAKSCELLGLGRRSLRRVAAIDGRMDVAALGAAVAADRRAGVVPLCVVATAGTVNTGATDDLPAIAALCRDEHIWLHVDGAFGALARLSPTLAPRVHGLEAADSLAFDLHKWGFLPYGIGVTLYRRAEDAARAFATQASYVGAQGGGIAPGELAFAARGIELSRPFRALKAWMSLKVQGVEGWARAIEENVAQARHLAARVAREPSLELVAPVPLNVVCFRVRGKDDLNRAVLVAIQERGIAVFSSTMIAGRFALRVCITNHRTTVADLDLVVDSVIAIAQEFGPAHPTVVEYPTCRTGGTDDLSRAPAGNADTVGNIHE